MGDQNKYMLAIVRHEKAKREVEVLTRAIGLAVNRCPVEIELMGLSVATTDHWERLVDEKTGKTKTHLWQAFRFREPSDCGYGMMALSEGGVAESLSAGSEFECEHCLRAYELIVKRKSARRELGHARLAIRALGRSAMRGGENG